MHVPNMVPWREGKVSLNHGWMRGAGDFCGISAGCPGLRGQLCGTLEVVFISI